MATVKKICGWLWPISALVICFCLFGIFKQCILLYFFSQPAEKFWLSRYYEPCGNNSDFGRTVLKTVIFFNNYEMSMELLETAIRAKVSQHQWESVSFLYSYVKDIDRDGSIDSAKWLLLCQPLDKRLAFLFQRSIFESQENTNESSAIASCEPLGLIKGYENHHLLKESEEWLVRLEERENRLNGVNSYALASSRLQHANFCVRQGRVEEAKKIISNIGINYTQENISFDKTGKVGFYHFKRKDGKNSVKFQE